jgi:hypothetical protein
VAVSKGTWGQFADDPDSIFIDEPMPRFGRVLLAMAVGAGGCYFAARHFGAGVPLALFMAFVGYAVPTAINIVVVHRRQRARPEFNGHDFDAVRFAGTRALDEFRRAHPTLPQVAWSLVGTREESKVIRVIGASTALEESTSTYVVAPDGSIVAVANDAYPGTGYSQRHVRDSDRA